MKYLCIFLNFRIHQAGQIEHPSGPDLAHGPYVWQPCFKKTLGVRNLSETCPQSK